MAASPGPVRFKDAKGAWVDIDLSVVAGPDGTLGPKASPSTARLSPRGDATVAVLDTAAGTIGLRHPQTTTAPAAAVAGREATYRGALGGRDLVLEPAGDGFEEKVILADRQAATSYLDEFTLPAGVSAANAEGGGIDFLDAAGAVVATFGQALAFDSSNGPGARGALGPVSVRLATKADLAVPGAAVAPAVAAGEVPTGLTGGARVLAERTAGAASVVTVTVSVDAAWAADSARVHPITIDPALNLAPINAATSGYDTWIYNQEYANTSFVNNTSLGVGTNDGGTHIARSILYFYLPAPAANIWVTESHVSLYNYGSGGGCAERGTTLSGLIGPTNGAVHTWNTRAEPDAAGVVSTTTETRNTATGSTCPGARVNYDATTLARRWMDASGANYGLELRAASETDTASFKWFYASESGAALAPILYITYTHRPNAAVANAPATGAVITTTTPRLSVLAGSDPDQGDTVSYWFRVTTSPDAESRMHIADSQFLPATSFTLPPGALNDGITYFWHVWTYDGIIWQEAPWVRSFRVDLGLGRRAGTPRDDVGPVSADLASGNLSAGFASPSFDTVAGPVGLTYAYNSAAPSPTAGLTGAYYAKPGATATASTHDIVPGDVPALVRRDQTVFGSWNGASPGPGLEGTNFTVRWSGFIAVPTAQAGNWTLGATHDDGVRITVGGNVVMDKWLAPPPGGATDFGTAVALSTTPVPIQIDYYQHLGGSGMLLLAVGPGTASLPGGFLIPPADWLSTEAPTMPTGWSVSPTFGAGVSSASVRAADGSVTVSDPSGGTHLYTATSAGGFSPPPGEHGVLGRDMTGRLVLHAGDGMAYGFNGDGTLASATSGADDTNPAAPCYAWAGTPSRLRGVVDPVSKRIMTLSYGGDIAGSVPNSCTAPTPATMPTLACPAAAPTGLVVAPTSELCAVTYWDGTSSKLWYNANGQLARMEDPGSTSGADRPPVVDFAYDTAGRLAQVRSPLVADAVAAGVVADDTAGTYRTVIAYDTTSGKVASVTAATPAPGGAATTRPAHSYVYASATETQVQVAGIDASAPGFAGFARKVTFDAAGRLLVDTDATGAHTDIVWEGDPALGPVPYRVLSVTDPAGRMSTTVYDPQGRPTDSYGPAPAACFGLDRKPAGPCAGLSSGMAHTATVYDTAYDASDVAAPMRGLAATYWKNATLTGAPARHLTGVGDAGGALSATWSAPPDAALGGSWSARYAGEITLGAAMNLKVVAGGTRRRRPGS